VNEADLYPYIDKEAELACVFMKEGKRVLEGLSRRPGHAKALGAKVYAGQEKEIGWSMIELTGEGCGSAYGKAYLHPLPEVPEKQSGLSLAWRDLRHTGRGRESRRS